MELVFCLEGKYPLIFNWHCLNHRLELAIWKIYPASYHRLGNNHVVQASEDTDRVGKTRCKYSGLSKRLGSIQFLLDLALT